MKNIEIEIQVQVTKIKPLIDFLQKNAKYDGEFHQIDKYFVPKHKNYIKIRPTSEWLRLRNANGKFSINYKNWYFNKLGKSQHCDEFETAVEDIKTMNQIFDALEIKNIATVDKKRIIYNYKKYEIAIDKVKGLGNFVEIEFKGNLQKFDATKITNEMIVFLKEHGVGKITRNYNGYPFIMLFPKEVKYEEM